MKTKYLFPNALKPVGWVLFLVGMVLGVAYLIYSPEFEFLNRKVFAVFGTGIRIGASEQSGEFMVVIQNNIFDEIIGLLIIVGALLIVFSKKKVEDEFIAKLRWESLVWATYVNYAILILAILFVYEMSFFWVLVFNMFTILIFFMVRFHWILFKTKMTASHEE